MARKTSLPNKKNDSVLANKNIYCRVCMKEQPVKEYFVAVDKTLDKNNYMSVCKTCCNELFSTSLKIEHNVDKAILRTCRILNIMYSQNAVDAVKTHMQTSGKENLQIFGIYKSKLSTLSNLSDDADLTFYSNDNITVSKSNDDITDDEDFDKYLKTFWGPDFEWEDYEYLESELSRYKKTHKCDTAAEESLLRQIVLTEFDLRNSRAGGKSGDNAIVKRLRELMQTASVDPAKASIANSGKAQDTFSAFIKTIEENEPASYYGQDSKKLFKDFDNIDFYFKKYITRPLKNFIMQSRDFNVDTEDDVDEVVDSEEGNADIG